MTLFHFSGSCDEFTL